MTAPQDIPGASSSSTPSTTTTTARNRANTFSYPRWDANGNSHHPPPDVVSPSSSSSARTLSRSQGVSGSNGNNATSTSMATSPSSPVGGSSSSSILRLLGLSPPASATSSSSSSSIANNSVRAGDTTTNSNNAGHRRGASYSSSSYMASLASSSPFYEDDEEDGPPEAVTPPQQLPLSMSAVAVAGGPPDAAARKKANKLNDRPPTNYGHELDEAHKLELDDSFDVSSPSSAAINIPGSGGDNKAVSREPLGRRASWSPARPDQLSSSPPAGVMSWLHGQQTSYPISATQAHYQAQGPAQQSAQSVDYGSSPVGLFRRLSLSVNRRPPPPAPASTISEVSDLGDGTTGRERIGRPLTKVASAPPRRLSPMGERMLRAHYDSFS